MRSIGISQKPSVFINCPYDQEFETLFLAIVFAITCQGFEPRSARESEGEPRLRFDRIVKALADSKYSIHDLSRFTGEGIDNIARFNMPLELGIAIGLHWRRPAHNWLVLVPQGHQHQRFISDLAGFDLRAHESTVKSMISEVCIWLSGLPDFARRAPSALNVFRSFPNFNREIRRLRKLSMRNPTWADIVDAAYATRPSA
jgi:hypothetical protein